MQDESFTTLDDRSVWILVHALYTMFFQQRSINVMPKGFEYFNERRIKWSGPDTCSHLADGLSSPSPF